MANPVGSILHCRYVLPDSSDRSAKYSFGWTFQIKDNTDSLITPSGAQLSNLTTNLIAFLNTLWGSQVNTMASYISPSASRGTNASELVAYDIANALGSGELAGSPYTVVPFTLGAAAAYQGLPEQVCQVLSWRANYGSDPEFGTSTRPRADDRNRMYFGPLHVNTTTTDTESPSRIIFTPGFLNDSYKAIEGVYGALFPGTITSYAWELLAWSRKLAAVKVATEYSAQNLPTTQRRRLSKRGLNTWTPLLTS